MIEIDRMVLATDWPAVRDIYADGLATSFAALFKQNRHRKTNGIERIDARPDLRARRDAAAFTPVADT